MIYEELSDVLVKAAQKIGFTDVQCEVVICDNPQFGDYSSNMALQLSKHHQQQGYQSPRDIANKLIELVHLPQFVERVEVAGPGFLNFFIKPAYFTDQLQLLNPQFLQSPMGGGQKVLLEHTSVNPNKAMHVGHLRNALIGDCLAAVLKKCGYQVEVQNYIDDTGVQVVDTYIGLKFRKELGFREKQQGEPVDDYYWELYTAVNKRYEADPSFLEHRQQVSREIEEPESKTAVEVKQIATEIVQATEQTLYQRFGILHDLYIWESDILKSGFWNQALELLKTTPGFENPKHGKNKGTWLVKIGDSEISDETGQSEGHDSDKIFVKSDGTTTYIAKDFAYNLWKFGLLGKDFKYRVWNKITIQDSGNQESQQAHVTHTSDQENGQEMHGFGNGDLVFTVIDERQSYLQQVILEVFKRLGYEQQSRSFRHVAYGFVSLSANTAAALGMMLKQEKRSYAMSGRKGIGVEVKKLHDLVTDRVKESKSQRVKGTKKSDSGREVDNSKVAAAAIKYFMLKFNSATEIAFDFDQALSLYGATGPYLQYTHARVCGILEKGQYHTWRLADYEPNQTEVELIKQLLHWRIVYEEVALTLEPSTVAQYAFTLAQVFNAFYEKNKVIGAETAAQTAFRLELLKRFQLVFHDVLTTLGIEAPERM